MGTSTRVLLLALRPKPSSAPPVIKSSSPVQKVASEARNTAAAPTSAGWPMRPRGWAKVPSRMVALGSEVAAASSCHSGVQMFPGEMQLTRTPYRLSSKAKALVMAVTAPLVAT